MLKKSIVLMFLFCSFTVFSDTLRDEYAADNGTYLDERDNATLKKLNSFDRNSKGGFAIMPGTVRFNYGSQIPTVVCAILELTDIAMEQNEHINSVQLGDGARWSVEFAKSGNESGFVEHLIVKPLDTGLKTSLIITTDKRTYHIRLKSTSSDFMQSVHFYYPENSKKKFFSNSNNDSYSKDIHISDDIPYQNTDKAYNKNTIQNNDFSAATFNYTVLDNKDSFIEGYFCSGRTILELKDKSSLEEAPLLFSIQNDGTGNKHKSAVNYRVLGNSIIADGAFKELLLQIKKDGDDLNIRIVR
ncbi:TrbG/VirB9 family P-type conjugative transfer protein [Succinivibrio sp.]|uniref:TrbG/VirB9 family P-type conjugative transfer protein n=1 Tax=Succinivibrio sp. TaxID=2053619 RepID=UPI0038659B10